MGRGSTKPGQGLKLLPFPPSDLANVLSTAKVVPERPDTQHVIRLAGLPAAWGESQYLIWSPQGSLLIVQRPMDGGACAVFVDRISLPQDPSGLREMLLQKSTRLQEALSAQRVLKFPIESCSMFQCWRADKLDKRTVSWNGFSGAFRSKAGIEVVTFNLEGLEDRMLALDSANVCGRCKRADCALAQLGRSLAPQLTLALNKEFFDERKAWSNKTLTPDSHLAPSEYLVPQVPQASIALQHERKVETNEITVWLDARYDVTGDCQTVRVAISGSGNKDLWILHFDQGRTITPLPCTDVPCTKEAPCLEHHIVNTQASYLFLPIAKAWTKACDEKTVSCSGGWEEEADGSRTPFEKLVAEDKTCWSCYKPYRTHGQVFYSDEN